KRLRSANGGIVLFRHASGHEQGDGGRDERHRQDHRAEQGADDGEGHGVKHFSFHAGEREDGHVNDGDDELAEHGGTAHFLGGGEGEFESLGAREQATEPVLRFAEAPQAVFNDDDRAVHDQSEVERAEAHQVARDLVGHHAGDGEEHGQRNHRGGDERGAEVPEQQEQHDDDQQRAFEQVGAHGGNGAIHERGAIIHRPGDHPLGQAAVYLGELGGGALGDLAGVFTDEHEDRAEHDFGAVFRGRAGAQFLAEADVGDIANADGASVTPRDRDGADLLDPGD